MVLVTSNFAIFPSRYLGISEQDLDRDCERAFILASLQKKQKDEEKAAKKAKQKAKTKRR